MERKEEFLQILYECGGYYSCPKDEHGKRLGPVVGYAGRDSQGRQRVGDVYCNFAKIEEHPKALAIYAKEIADKVRAARIECDYVMGIPMGGLSIAQALAKALDVRYIFVEHEDVQAQGRKDKHFFLGRHEITPGSKVIICEDVCNNFSSTDKVIKVIEDAGAEVVAIACELNRSLDHQETFGDLPIIAAINEPMLEYEQDDPEVASDIADGHVSWKPKKDWKNLQEIMQTYHPSA